MLPSNPSAIPPAPSSGVSGSRRPRRSSRPVCEMDSSTRPQSGQTSQPWTVLSSVDELTRWLADFPARTCPWLGNGVVPQQAELAFRLLLGVINA